MYFAVTVVNSNVMNSCAQNLINRLLLFTARSGCKESSTIMYLLGVKKNSSHTPKVQYLTPSSRFFSKFATNNPALFI